MKKYIIGCLVTLGLFALTATAAPSGPTPEQALKWLKEGQQRYLSGKMQSHDIVKERKNLVSGQAPYAAILACADSRVSPEVIFDEALGRLFVVRVAGNVADAAVIASLEYTVKVLGSKALLVLGHERCGAVDAAIKDVDMSPNLDVLLALIEPAAKVARDSGQKGPEALHLGIEENVRVQMKNLTQRSTILKAAVDDKQLHLSGGVFNLQTHKVTWIQ